MAAADAQKQAWMRGDSALKGAMLSLLLKKPSHAYGLARLLNRLLGPTWNIEPKSLYPKLEQLAREGLFGLTLLEKKTSLKILMLCSMSFAFVKQSMIEDLVPVTQ